MKQPLHAAVAIALSAAACLAVIVTPAHAAPRITPGQNASVAAATATFTRVTQWPGGYVGNITVHNGTAATLRGWRVEFDLGAQDRVTGHFGGQFSRTENRHVGTNLDWNGVLAPGASATFGWVAEGSGTPTDCRLNGARCDGVPLDFTDPRRPRNLRFDLSNGATLSWDHSTDDHGVVGYDVYESDRLLAIVTDNRYVYSNGPTLPPRVYIFAVRALDAAGNHSALAYRTLGRYWEDRAPEAPSQLRVETAATGLLRLLWTPPTPPDPPSRLSPPIAGYEVYFNGRLVAEVGRASFVMPIPPPGRHTFGVRTINAVDRFSEMAVLEAGGI